MWDPDANISALLEEFYPAFYGPAAAPMARYWSRIFDAWERTNVTEHEYLAIPAIYTPALVEDLRTDLTAAEASLRSLAPDSGDAAIFEERMRFTRASFEVIDTYVATALAAARDADYASAVTAGNKALEAQASLRALNPLFVSGLIGVEDQTAWLAGEIQQYKELSALMDGSKGTLVQRLPLKWSFKVEKPLAAGWRYEGPEGPVPVGHDLLAAEEPSSASGWRDVLTSLYLQGQGVTAPDGQSQLGHYWYRTVVNIGRSDSEAKLRLNFPGLFNEAWLYINGRLVAHRAYKEPWWRTNYNFKWDVDVSGHLRPGPNEIALRGFNAHHWGGIFRRPFMHRPR